MGYIGQDKSQDYQGERDAQTLHDAHAIRKDPKKHAHALKHLKKMAKYSTHAQHTHTFEQAQQQPQGGMAEAGEEQGSPVAGE